MRDNNNPGNAGRGQLPVAVPGGQGGMLAPVHAVTPSTVLAELRQAEAPASDEINLLDARVIDAIPLREVNTSCGGTAMSLTRRSATVSGAV